MIQDTGSHVCCRDGRQTSVRTRSSWLLSIVAVMFAVILSLALVGCGSPKQEFTLLTIERDVPQYAQSEFERDDVVAFEQIPQRAAKLGAVCATALPEGENTVFSPYAMLSFIESVGPSLSDEGKAQIATVFGMEPDEMLRLCCGVAFTQKELKEKSRLRFRSLLVAPDTSDTHKEFVLHLQNHSITDLAVAGFDNPAALKDKIAAYFKHTPETQLFDPQHLTEALDFERELPVMTDELSFRDLWDTPFSDVSENRLFRGIKAGVEEPRDIPFLVGKFKGYYADAEDYFALGVPFDSGSMMVFYLPRNNHTPEEALSIALDTSSWATLSPAAGVARIPEFEIDQARNCAPLLSAAGLTLPFDMSAKAVEHLYDDQRSTLGQYVQSARIGVNKAGCLMGYAPRVTSSTLGNFTPEEDVSFDLTFDRPFAYIIISNNIPLFAGTVYSL